MTSSPGDTDGELREKEHAEHELAEQAQGGQEERGKDTKSAEADEPTPLRRSKRTTRSDLGDLRRSLRTRAKKMEEDGESEESASREGSEVSRSELGTFLFSFFPSHIAPVLAFSCTVVEALLRNDPLHV